MFLMTKIILLEALRRCRIAARSVLDAPSRGFASTSTRSSTYISVVPFRDFTDLALSHSRIATLADSGPDLPQTRMAHHEPSQLLRSNRRNPSISMRGNLSHPPIPCPPPDHSLHPPIRHLRSVHQKGRFESPSPPRRWLSLCRTLPAFRSSRVFDPTNRQPRPITFVATSKLEAPTASAGRIWSDGRDAEQRRLNAFHGTASPLWTRSIDGLRLITTGSLRMP
jgi:hypothetical protein